MLNRALLNGAIELSVDTATIPHFTAEKLGRFQIPYCTPDVQGEIAREVTEEHRKADAIIRECNELHDLLLTRRHVLISDVVSGKKEV